MREQAERERKAKEEAERKSKEEADRRAREGAEKQRAEEAEKARLQMETEMRAKLEAEYAAKEQEKRERRRKEKEKKEKERKDKARKEDKKEKKSKQEGVRDGGNESEQAGKIELNKEHSPMGDRKASAGMTSIAEVKDDGRAEVNLAIARKELEEGEYLAEGGFGQVYVGRYRGMAVAIKKLKVALTDKAMLEFKHETAIMAQLRYEHIMHLVGVCMEPGYYCMVMPYMAKGSLFNVIHDDKEALEWPLRLQIALEMAEGLQFLHAQSPVIIHRDLKSLNVLLDRKYTVKVADFGLSLVKSETSSKSSKALGSAVGGVGTLRWKAPELMGLKPKHTALSDVYALGMTLWELASRQIPYEGADDVAIREEVKQGAREEIEAEWGAPEAYTKIIEVCWKQDASGRPTAMQVVSALAQLIGTFSGDKVSAELEAGVAGTPVRGGPQGKVKAAAMWETPGAGVGGRGGMMPGGKKPGGPPHPGAKAVMMHTPGMSRGGAPSGGGSVLAKGPARPLPKPGGKKLGKPMAFHTPS